MYDAYAHPPSTDHTAPGPDEYATVRDAAGDILHLVQLDYQRALALTRCSAHQPLTGLERLELSSLYSLIGNAFFDVADVWATYRVDPDDPDDRELGIAAAYRRQAEAVHDAAALNEALADIAPAHAADDPIARR